MHTNSRITVVMAHDALARYEAYVTRQLKRTFWSGDTMQRTDDYQRRSDWIAERRDYLRGVVAAAIERQELSTHNQQEVTNG